ncbi:peptide-methionine (S)-S-oxide reductase [Pontibacter ummariensis]|uniref:Peptide methionine sulfoxide reductase MsrA n=1 Tax=Pontibacter ummariensis TaxID=1610492 RepID=A0A239BSK8_9BACT|nr:peptide-methionine (S)-S-oxide reductase MsrA [Pontibacter ummariensis]PRY15679.1 peptide-methionine (S)-S-oxide reductase [Pontibacter ummariensis]SNS10143.1 peptide-methionine (S)-S-oxide reductase [Pontibacter ummariensis]
MILNKLYFILPLILLVNSCTEGNTSSAVVDGDVETLAAVDTTGLAQATFASGCFWCTEAYFERVEGVKAVISGYAGGEKPNPTYEEVSAGATDYAEVVQVYYDPEEVSYQELVEVFFATHDPTTLNRQGPDIGAQYRSIAFYRNPEQEAIIRTYIQQLEESGAYKNDIVTEVQPFERFWEAEAYHQDYYRRNPNDPYVVSVARPKVQKFEANYQDKLKPEYVQ